MNKTEQKAFEWLKNKGYKETEIIFRSKDTPDFICSDASKYEVKFLYGSKIIFYNNQFEQMQDEDWVLVFDENKFIMDFKWKDRNTIPITIKLIKSDTTTKTIRISDQVWKQLTQLKLDCGSKTTSEVIEKILRGEDVIMEDKQ